MRCNGEHRHLLSTAPHPARWIGAMLGLWLSTLAAAPSWADDWPQWLGPRRDSVWREEGIIDRIPADGLKTRWRVPIAGGYAGPAMADGRVYVMDYVTEGDQTPNPDQRSALQGTERLLCLSAADGELLWKHQYECPYEISYPAGPRATPTVHDNRVYSLGAEGDLYCLDAASGAVVWSCNFKTRYGAKTPLWGFCGHPLVDAEKLICLVGGPDALVVAFNRENGKELWRSGNGEEIGYSAPTIVEHGNQRQLIIWHAKALTALNPETGKVLWSEPLDPNYGMSIVTPRQAGGLLFVGGIINKSLMVRLDDQHPQARVQWYGTNEIGIDPVHSTPFSENGFLYGVTREGKLSAVRMDDGQVVWSHFELMPEKRRAHSGTVFVVKHQDRFFLCTDSGELVMARLSPEGYEELGRAKILEPTGDAMGRAVVWSHPAFANRCIFARNDKVIVCLSLDKSDY
jgi:outer membrane protein assembly factor BamB